MGVLKQHVVNPATTFQHDKPSVHFKSAVLVLIHVAVHFPDSVFLFDFVQNLVSGNKFGGEMVHIGVTHAVWPPEFYVFDGKLAEFVGCKPVRQRFACRNGNLLFYYSQFIIYAECSFHRRVGAVDQFGLNKQVGCIQGLLVHF